MIIDLYRTLRMVEEEIVEMKKRQQTVLSTYQQQTREDIVKKFTEADHTLLEAAEQKVKEINSLKGGMPYLITGNRKVSCISVRRVGDEGLTVEIDPIIYPTPYNLKFVLKEPSVGLYSPSKTRGIFSANSTTSIRAVEILQQMNPSDVDRYMELWVTHSANENFADKLKAVQEKIRNMQSSAEIVVESMLIMSSPQPPRQLIFHCEDHERNPTHDHERTVPPSAVKALAKNHLKM
jgi:hypothetical protein